ncbi:MAG: Holliday junction branch migration protein RuvA [Halioglobus sp.]|jgi:Holliday junction DNA helicase RuvA|nr:Holliday junction branch migration protein RuvA [Halieaceae bacterium]MDG1386906.1 Holliday junction branch migration protein RuvA [Halioglobus sp.]MBT5008312.1 Holliday junction branch migration protein RuvA [Halieaceae bacterium]MBT6124103.1 Holliday junction branch migration protein RuvA [Halieaceae bacterium]MBT7720947.1 Holliday junction branch migration protein RuvA [Halieaceae bacterium]
MIGRIRGNLVHKQPPVILVEVGGVGYELQVPMTTLFQLPELGAEVSLVTHFVVREDAQLLYGFAQERDRALFRQLIKVSGVGPKLALTILSGMDSASFARCVQRDDISSLVALPGVGKKTAERLLVEMRDKLKDWLGQLDGELPSSGPAQSAAPVDRVADAEGALIALGYKPAEAARMVAAVNDDSVENSEDLIRRALKSMVSG